jgi:hypothetical protein
MRMLADWTAKLLEDTRKVLRNLGAINTKLKEIGDDVVKLKDAGTGKRKIRDGSDSDEDVEVVSVSASKRTQNKKSRIEKAGSTSQKLGALLTNQDISSVVAGTVIWIIIKHGYSCRGLSLHQPKVNACCELACRYILGEERAKNLKKDLFTDSCYPTAAQLEFREKVKAKQGSISSVLSCAYLCNEHQCAQVCS